MMGESPARQAASATQPRTPSPPVPTLLQASVPRACSLGVSLKSSRPGQDPPPAAPRLPPTPRLRGLTWGRGPALPTAPSSSSARRRGPGAPAMAGRSGLGHRCHLRNRARRLIPGGQRARGRSRHGPPRPREGPGGVPGLPPRPAAAAPPAASSSALLGPSQAGRYQTRCPLSLCPDLLLGAPS